MECSSNDNPINLSETSKAVLDKPSPPGSDVKHILSKNIRQLQIKKI